MKLVVKISPFALMQNLFVVSDEGETIDKFTISFSELNDKIFNCINSYSLNQIDLVGPKSFSLGVKKTLLKENVNKYNNQELDIKII